ncbi:hypothetical protein C9374_010507 [Naegleria lovaniensis]|uniref:Uncharacterized protein n=1 Tax=Naegleria lovaniensis TaxID=51637 RepID=A0AA88KE73_NAELO|nr:uncharacterized protein C9374_010507 [Naegleria lovaniensis]KAG2374763.1 hypothetical protein C9374_010507 [Naegleria lovaniensis]
MPPTKYYNPSHGRSSSNRNSSSTQQTTPTTPTPPSGVSIMSNKSSTTLDPRLASNASAIIPQPRRRRSSVSREQSPPSDDVSNENSNNNNQRSTDAAFSPNDDQKQVVDMNDIGDNSSHDYAAINTFNTTSPNQSTSHPSSTNNNTNNHPSARNQPFGGFYGTLAATNKDSHAPLSHSNNNHSHHHSNHHTSHHHHHHSHSNSSHQVSQHQSNITDDDSDIQAGLSTNAIQKIYNTTLQFNAESILAAVDQLQNRRAEQFPDETGRLRYSIRDVLDIGTSNPICTEKHPDLPDLDYRKLDWGITQAPSSSTQSSSKPVSSSDPFKRPPRQHTTSESASNPFGSTSRRGASSRSQSGGGIGGRDSSAFAQTLSSSASTGNNSRYAALSSTSGGSTVVRTGGGKGAIWFDSSASNDELTNEELERKKAFEEFRKTHQATTGAGSFFGDLSNTEGEALEEDYHTSLDEETFGTDLHEMKESSNASDLESYFFTLSSHQNEYGQKEHSLSELEDSFLNLPTPSSLAPSSQKRDKPLFALGDTKTDAVPPFVSEDPVISTMIKGTKSGKSRFGFGSFDEQQLQSNISPASLLDEHLPSGRAMTAQPLNDNSFAYPQSAPNLQGLFTTGSLSSQQQVSPLLRPMNAIPEFLLTGNAQTGGSKFSSIEKGINEEETKTAPAQFDQFAVIDSANQVSMMSAEDLENQFLLSLNDSSSQPLKQASPPSESSKIPALSNQGIEHLFKSLSSTATLSSTDSFTTAQNNVELPLATTATPKFVSPFQQYQEHKEKAEKNIEDNTQPGTPSKQPTVKASTPSQSTATGTQRKLSKTSANSPFVPSHLMKKMGTNTEKKIKLKVTPSQATTTTSTSNAQTTVKTGPQTSSNQPVTASDASTSSNAAITHSNIPQQQSSPTTDTITTALPSTTTSSLPHYASSQQNTQPQNMINTAQPPNMQSMHPVSPLMDQMQPQPRMMHDKRFLFNPNSPFPNNPSAFIPPIMHPGFVPPHQPYPNAGGMGFPNVPPGFMQNTGVMYPNMFMPSQEMMSVEDLEKEFLNHK